MTLYSVDQYGRVIVPDPASNPMQRGYRPPHPTDFVPELNCTQPSQPYPPIPVPPPNALWTGDHDFWWYSLGAKFGGNTTFTYIQDLYGNWYVSLNAGVAAGPIPVSVGGGVGIINPNVGGPVRRYPSEDELENAILGPSWTFELTPGFGVSFNPPIQSMLNAGDDFVEAFFVADKLMLGIGFPAVSFSGSVTLMFYDANSPDPWPSPFEGKNRQVLRNLPLGLF